MKLRHFTLLLLAVSALFSASAQTPMNEVNLNDMTFVRQSFVRNFYNSQKVMSQINMEGTNLFLKNSANIVIEHATSTPNLTQDGRTLHIGAAKEATSATLRVGAFHPYLCYEATFSNLDKNEEVGIIFYPNNGKGSVVKTLYKDGKIYSALEGDGEQKILAEATTEKSKKVALRVQYTGMRFHVFRLYDNGEAKLLYSVAHDKRNIDSCIKDSFGITVFSLRTARLLFTRPRAFSLAAPDKLIPKSCKTPTEHRLFATGSFTSASPHEVSSRFATHIRVSIRSILTPTSCSWRVRYSSVRAMARYMVSTQQRWFTMRQTRSFS